ncbi:MAG: orotate phosphoribosyltransferase, partial [Armatimonadota bacterium]|nr:orotate phosphoribosyltransferase [Armatimonadota bacterium]
MQHEKLAKTLMDLSYMVNYEDLFVLASGRTSPFYFDCERTTTFALALPLIAEAFYEKLRLPLACVGGPTRGADPIADA